MEYEIFQKIAQTIIEGDPEATVELTQQALDAGVDAMAIIRQGLMPGMDVVGEKFGAGEYFLPDLIIAADGMQQAMVLLEPELQANQQTLETAGKVVLGTVKGDIHEIGKSLVGTMLSANGFKVYDLGVDVPTEKFIATVKETGANLLGLSALLTTTMTVQQQVIEALSDAGLRAQVKVMVGGAPVTEAFAKEIGADAYAPDAASAVDTARALSA